MDKWLSFPEALYMVSYAPVDFREGGVVQLAVDATRFIDVEDFFKGNCPGSMELLDIEKTYAYAKMYAGDNGERMDFQLGFDLKNITTYNVEETNEFLSSPRDEASWSEIIHASIKYQQDKHDFSKKIPS